MSKKGINLFFNTSLLFLCSFLSIKLLFVFGKWIVASFFHIETEIIAYTLFPISSANSGVWTFPSVYSFFSVEPVLLMAIIVFCTYLLFFHNVKQQQIVIVVYWVLITSLIITLSSVFSGIITKSNIFHLLNWLHISYSVMLLGVMVGFIVGVGGVAWFFNRYMKKCSVKVFNSDTKKVIIFGYKHVFPGLLAAIVLLYVPYIFSSNKYVRAEFVLLLLFASSVILVKGIKNRQVCDELNKKPNSVYAIIVALLYGIFIVFNTL